MRTSRSDPAKGKPLIMPIGNHRGLPFAEDSLARRSAFSLVELLIVIGIIAILLAILLPVISSVRKAARSASCLANLHTWGQAFTMYVSNNGGHSLIDRRDITDPTWYEVLALYNGDVHGTLVCPSASDPGNIIGSATQAWGPIHEFSVGRPQWIVRDIFVGSYGINGWLYNIPADARPGLPDDWKRHMIELPTNNAQHIPVFGDCIGQWAMPRDTDTPPTNLQNPLPRSDDPGAGPAPKGMMSYFCIDRHRHAVNLVFLDGHAENVRLEELWKLQWNNDFTAKDVAIP